MNGQDLLQAVQPGYQGMLPQDSEDLNPNQQPDHFINKKLGKGPGYNPVQIALNRREMISEIEKAVEQLITIALTEGKVLSRPEAIAKVKTAWASQAQAKTSSTSLPQPSTPTSNQPLSPQAKQDFLNKTQAMTKVGTIPFAATIPQPSTPAPDSPTPDEIISEAIKEGGKRHNEMVAAAFYGRTPNPPEAIPTVADIKRALIPEIENGIFDEEIEATEFAMTDLTMEVNPLTFEEQAQIAETQQAEPTPPEGPRAIVEGDTGGTSTETVYEGTTTIMEGPLVDKSYDPVVDKIFKDMVEPLSTLEDEIDKDALADLHESTEQLLKFLPRRNCIQFFRQSLSMAGLPAWSRWSNDNRAKLEAAYLELVADPFEVDQIVRKLQGFTVRYGKTRLLRMVATLIGIQAWMSLEISDGR